MNPMIPQRPSHHDPPPPPRYPSDDLRHILTAAHAVLDQTPPPSLREILSAYRNKGDGDRDMLLAMLNAKTAEDQRISSLASLQRTVIELHQHSSEALQPPSRTINGAYQYALAYAPPSSYPCDQRPSRRTHSHRANSRSRSPPRQHPHMPPPPRDMPIPHHSEHPRKRHRSSRSPRPSHPNVYETSHPSEQFPPSPYSSSDRSESAEYSPRSRASMTIGSLLSTAPRREINGDAANQERD